MRLDAGLNVDEAAKALECSPARVSLIENGKQATRPKDVREMARVYGVEDAARVAAVEDLAKQSSEKGWWAGFEDVLPTGFATYVDLETDARELLGYSAAILNGLLQIPDYARAINRATVPDGAPERLDRLVELRMARQERLVGDSPLSAWFVLDEATLRRPIGGRETMRAQLAHVLELADRPNITIQTLPFAKGAHASLSGSFALLRFPDPSQDPDVVYSDGPTGNIYLETVDYVQKMIARFDRLRALAQDEDESKTFIATVLEEM
jgi:transcriptional regulator with XRE-family HTH domain